MSLVKPTPASPTARVFFALWPGTAERQRFAMWQSQLQVPCGGRRMRAETLHNTLIFIGNIERPRLVAMALAAQEVSAEGFELCFDKARYWGHNHIVYASPTAASAHLFQLVSGLKGSLAKHGFVFDDKEYEPHVTLLRNARCGESSLSLMPPVCWPVRDFVLVQSVPQNGGTRYRVLSRFPLVSGAAPPSLQMEKKG